MQEFHRVMEQMAADAHGLRGTDVTGEVIDKKCTGGRNTRLPQRQPEDLRLRLPETHRIRCDRIIEPAHKSMLPIDMLPMHRVYVRDHRQAVTSPQFPQDSYGVVLLPEDIVPHRGKHFKREA